MSIYDNEKFLERFGKLYSSPRTNSFSSGRRAQWTEDEWRSWFTFKYGEGRFDYLLDSLFGNCQTLESISQELGVTRERVRQWRNKIRKWRPEFVSQRTQRKYCTILNRPNIAAKHVKNFIPSPAMAYCMKRAKEEGLEVSLVSNVNYRIKSAYLTINNRLWRVHSIAGTHRYHTNHAYYHVGNFKQDHPRIVCCFDGSQWTAFIFPLGVSRAKSIYIPTDLDWPVYHNKYPAIDWKLYREAWHLLRKRGEKKLA
mgnify:CR=1 FL=1